MTRLFLALGVACALVSVPGSIGAQRIVPADSVRDDASYSFWARGPYRPQVPRPDSLLGYPIGAKQTQYADQQRVLLAIAEAARDRVHVEQLGTTPEGRTMRLFLVSSPENIQRLDAIRADLDRLADPRGASAAELDAIVGRTPAVVWISFSVHGNESPGFEAVMPILYQLAASEEPATANALRNTLVVLNPSSNPDGHERFAVWYNSIAVGHPDPGAMEHDEPWSIQGRYNHYRFDLNRDVMASTQQEVRAMIRGMLRWHPMVAVDEHGMTDQYFFPPAARPINENLGPLAEKWLDIIGRGNAAAFDAHGWQYYVRDVFDLYYPGYWDTWPSLTGATGMTYETDGGGWKGLLWRRDDGTLLSFRDGIAKHTVAGLATIETVAGRSTERVRDYVRFRQGAIEDGRTGRIRRVVLLPGKDPQRAAELAAALLRSGIEVRRATAPFSAARAHRYAGGDAGARRFDAGAYVIDLAQPNGKLAKAFLEPAPVLDSVFARQQIEKFRRNLRRAPGANSEWYEFYDVTAWSLPVAFGVDAYWTEDAGAVTGELLRLPADTTAAEVLPVAPAAGIIAGANARTAYVWSPAPDGARALAFALLAEGYNVAAASQPIEAAGRRWPRGTFVVRVTRNDSTIHSRLDALARARGVEVIGVNTAYTTEGQYGVGSEPVVNLKAPRVAVVGGEGISQTGYGAIWWGLEQRYGIRFMPIDLGYLAGGNIAQFDVIVVPDASGGALRARIGESQLGRLKTWIRNGGTLVTMGGATAWAAGDNVELVSARLVGAEKSNDTGTTASPAADDTTEMRRLRARLPDQSREELLAVTSPEAQPNRPVPVPGSHFDVVLDRTHWLTHGYEEPRLTVMLSGDEFLGLSRDGANVAVFPATGPLHRAGFVWPDNTERLLRNTALLVEEPLGGGHVVAFVNEPMFRGWWRALDGLVLNAMLLGPAF